MNVYLVVRELGGRVMARPKSLFKVISLTTGKRVRGRVRRDLSKPARTKMARMMTWTKVIAVEVEGCGQVMVD